MFRCKCNNTTVIKLGETDLSSFVVPVFIFAGWFYAFEKKHDWDGTMGLMDWWDVDDGWQDIYQIIGRLYGCVEMMN